MDFWKNLLDPTYNRKTKAWITATVLVCLKIITPTVWGAVTATYTSVVAVEKWIKKNEKT